MSYFSSATQPQPCRVFAVSDLSLAFALPAE